MRYKSSLKLFALSVTMLISITSADNWSTGTSGKITSASSTKVGIGTSTPTNPLEVNGNLKASSFQGDGKKISNVTPVGEYSVTKYGAIPNDTGTDYTSQFQTALDSASKFRGGIVIVPPGKYRINGTLIIPAGVTLKGSWDAPHDAVLDSGSTLYAYSGRDNASGTPFILLRSNAAVVGITIYYPSQLPDAIHAYPWTIAGGFDGDIINVTLANSYQGIWFGGNHNSHFIKNVNIAATNYGVLVNDCRDIGRLENVHIHNKFWWTAGNFLG